MKSKLLFHLLLFSALLNSYHSAAQPRTFGGGIDFVTINNITLPISSLSIMDSLDAANQKVHTASFEMKFNSNEQGKKLWTDLQSSFQSQERFSLVFSRANNQYAVIEQRNYSGTQVKELLLSGLAAAAKEPVILSVAIQAEQVTIVNAKGEKMNNPMGKSMLLASNYKFELDGQVMNKVMQISSLHIGASSGGTQHFFLDIPATDATFWYDWFNTAKTGEKKKTARVTLLSIDLKTELLSLELKDIEIISLSMQSNSNQETITRTEIGLRYSGVVIK